MSYNVWWTHGSLCVISISQKSPWLSWYIAEKALAELDPSGFCKGVSNREIHQADNFHMCIWSSQLFKHNEAAIELQIGPSSTNKQEWDTTVATMVYHFLAPEGGHPTWEENFIEKIPKCHTSKLNQEKQRYVVSKSATNIHQSSKYKYFPIILLLNNNEKLFNFCCAELPPTF